MEPTGRGQASGDRTCSMARRASRSCSVTQDWPKGSLGCRPGRGRKPWIPLHRRARESGPGPSASREMFTYRKIRASRASLSKNLSGPLLDGMPTDGEVRPSARSLLTVRQAANVLSVCTSTTASTRMLRSGLPWASWTTFWGAGFPASAVSEPQATSTAASVRARERRVSVMGYLQIFGALHAIRCTWRFAGVTCPGCALDAVDPGGEQVHPGWLGARTGEGCGTRRQRLSGPGPLSPGRTASSRTPRASP